MLTLHIIQALYGDCLLLAYGDPARPHHLLIDGGPETVYLDHLRPVLQRLAAAGGELDCVVLTHPDDDHIIGLVEFFAEQRRRQLRGEPPLIPVQRVWCNTFAFDSLMAPSLAHPSGLRPQGRSLPQPAQDSALPGASPPLQGVAEGLTLRQTLAALALPVNPEFTGGIAAVEHAPASLTVGALKLHLLGPTVKGLARLQREWAEWAAKHPVTPPLAAPTAPLPPAALLPPEPERVAPDQSIPNRASIMFVAELRGKRILFTGDGRAGDILAGLERAGLLAKGGTVHVNVMKVAHHGSARNNSRALFDRVQADTYVFSANGKDGNPDRATLVWLLKALKAQQRKAKLVLTTLTPTVQAVMKDYPRREYGYTVKVMPGGANALAVKVG